MSSHPINLTFRLLLEMAALVAFGYWGWQKGEGWLGYVLAVLIPVIFASIWGVFAVPNHPSRSAKAPVPTNGVVRLCIEWCFFSLAVWALMDTDHTRLAWILGLVCLMHYLLSIDRMRWLWNQK